MYICLWEILLINTLSLAGIRVHETNENELVFEPAVRWAGNPHITVAVKILSARPIVQVRICLFFRRKTFATVMFFDAYS